MSSPNSRRKLLVLLSRHRRLLQQILRHQSLLRGSFHQVHTRCGKSNCWCAKADQGHAHARLTWSEDGTMITRKVGAAERPAVTKLTARYKHFCDQRRQLSDLEFQIQKHLDNYETALIKKGQKALGFLIQKAPKAGKIKLTLQTRPTRQK